MKKLKRLWRAFEEPYGVRGVREDWRRFAGAELAVASHFLRKLKEPAAAFPCPRRGGDGCPRRVVVHGPGDIVAVCGCAPKECDTVKLKPEDIGVYEIGPKRFCGFLSESWGLAPVAEPLESRNDIWHVGSWTVSAADHRPVFFVAPPSRSSFEAGVGMLLISFQGPFVVLAPTLRFSGATATEGLRQRGAALLALEEIVLQSDEGKLVVAGTLPELLTAGGRLKPVAAEEKRNSFRREQDFWVLAFNGKMIRLKHLAGLGYIAELLRAPGTEIEALALTRESSSDEPVVAANAGLELADEITIKVVRSELEQRKRELAQLGPSDWVHKGDLTGEIKKLEDYLRDVEGLHGRSRKVAGNTQRARLATKNAIDRAISRIEAEHPDLAGHLKDSIRTGTTLIYMPLQPAEWTF